MNNLKEFINNKFINHDSITDMGDVCQSIIDGDADIEASNYRLIRVDSIDDILESELGDDLYILGYFNADFLADILDIDYDAIKAMQDAEAFEAVGKLIISMDKIPDLAAAYSSADGYGHHFAHYDHETIEIGEYFAFKTN